MRKTAIISSHSYYRRAMICQRSENTSLFLFRSEQDSSCDEEQVFHHIQDAYRFAKKKFNILESQWIDIPNAPKGCYEDFFYAVYRDEGERREALIQAADGELEWVRALLSAGTDPNGMPLIMAIQANEPEILKAMIGAGADVNLEYQDTTPLIHAIRGRRPEIVRILIDAGANVLKPASDGKLPLQVAQEPSGTNSTEDERLKIILLLGSQSS